MKKLLIIALLFMGCSSNPVNSTNDDLYIEYHQCEWWEFWCTEDKDRYVPELCDRPDCD